MDFFTAIFNQGWIGNVLALISMPLAVFFWVRPRRVTKPSIIVNAQHALSWPGSSSLPTGIAITYQGKAVPRLARCEIRFWNAGSEDLERSSIRSTDPLRLELHDGEVLAVAKVKESEPANKCNVIKDPDNPAVVLIDFDFVGRNDGIVFGILHTSSRAQPILKGQLRNLEVSFATGFRGRQLSNRLVREVTKNSRALAGISLFMGVLSAIAGIKPTLVGDLQSLIHIRIFESVTRSTPDFSLIIVGVMYCMMSSTYFWSTRRRYPKSLELSKSESKSND